MEMKLDTHAYYRDDHMFTMPLFHFMGGLTPAWLTNRFYPDPITESLYFCLVWHS